MKNNDFVRNISRSPRPMKFTSIPSPTRRRWFSTRLDSSDDPKTNPTPPKQVYDREGVYNLISSLATDGFHYPVFDVDIPCRYVKSSTKGHGHLYFDSLKLTWPQYVLLLTTLAQVGVIDEAYLLHSLNHGMSTVRPEHVRKKRADRPAKKMKAPKVLSPDVNPEWF